MIPVAVGLFLFIPFSFFDGDVAVPSAPLHMDSRFLTTHLVDLVIPIDPNCHSVQDRGYELLF